jgi:hypothetical protein
MLKMCRSPCEDTICNGELLLGRVTVLGLAQCREVLAALVTVMTLPKTNTWIVLNMIVTRLQECPVARNLTVAPTIKWEMPVKICNKC